MGSGEGQAEARRIVIAGGGVAGWAAATMLARMLPPAGFTVTLVEVEGAADNVGALGPAETTLPASSAFHAWLGIDEDRLLAEASGTFTLGTAWAGWGGEEASFMPFGEVGAPLEGVAFHHLALRLREAGKAVRLANYSLATIAAQLGRFTRPSNDARSILSSFAYGLQVDLQGYARLMEGLAERLGVARAAAPFGHALLSEVGDIHAVALRSGERIEGDLFIDASGPAAVLIGGALGTPFESWRRWLPCDNFLSLRHNAQGPTEPYACVSAHPAGWRRSVAVRGYVAETFAYCSAFLEPDRALDAVRPDRSGDARANVEAGGVEFGRRAVPWHRNCIAIGTAAATVEPLGATGLHLLHSELTRLARLFPSKDSSGAERAEYVRTWTDEVDRLRDFLMARYKLNGRRGEPFWEACAQMEVPEPLSRKIALYRSRGRVSMEEEEPFEERDWTMLFDAQGVRTRRYDLRADALDAERIERHMDRLRELILKAAAGLPLHDDYLRRHGAARRTA
jgi:tryptophan halogenase